MSASAHWSTPQRGKSAMTAPRSAANGALIQTLDVLAESEVPEPDDQRIDTIESIPCRKVKVQR